jgi:hypothetical protein
MSLRNIIIIILLILSVIDLTTTYIYVKTYRHWQPNKPYNLIENNPMLTFLWNNIGLELGMLVGAGIILTLIYIIGKSAWMPMVILLLCVLVWAMYNHYNNFTLLIKLIKMYPSGYLPEAIFGLVIGNNEIKKIHKNNRLNKRFKEK